MKMVISKNNYYLIYASEYNSEFKLIAVTPNKFSADTYCNEHKNNHIKYRIETINMIFYDKQENV